MQADHAHPPLDLQTGEIEIAQLGGDVRCAALDHDLPWDGGVERDRRCAHLPAQYPQTAWIANSDLAIFGLHIWHSPLKASLIQRGHLGVRAQAQLEDASRDDEPAAPETAERSGEVSLPDLRSLTQPDNLTPEQRVAALLELQKESDLLIVVGRRYFIPHLPGGVEDRDGLAHFVRL